MTLKKIEKRRAATHEYINKVKRSSSWGKRKKRSEDRDEIERMVSRESGIKITTVRLVLRYLFGSERHSIKGAIQRVLDEGRSVDIDAFGTFSHREMKCKITNDISQPGTMTYTPACSTIKFTPCSRMYWDHFQASMAANMPSEPLPDNMHFSQRIQGMQFYKDWLSEMSSLSNPETTD